MTDQPTPAAATAYADMRIEVVKRELNQGALAGFDSAVTDYAARLVIAALDSFEASTVQLAHERGVAEGRRLAAEALRKAAAGRRTYAESAGVTAGILEAEAGMLDLAADAAGGDLKPMYGWLPSWQWTPEMAAALDEQPVGPWEPTEQPEGGAR